MCQACGYRLGVRIGVTRSKPPCPRLTLLSFFQLQAGTACQMRSSEVEPKENTYVREQTHTSALSRIDRSWWPSAHSRNRENRQTSEWRHYRPLRRHRSAGQRLHGQQTERPRLSPADRGLPRKYLFRRKNSRRLLQARRPPHGKRDSCIPPDRPPDAPAVPRFLAQ